MRFVHPVLERVWRHTMAMQTTLEIMVQQHGRWVIHARYPITKKEAAVEEAKTLEKTPGIGAVKVIKDVYDQSRGGYALKGFEGDITLYEVVWDEELFARKQAGEPKGLAPAPAPAARPAAAPRPAVATAPR